MHKRILALASICACLLGPPPTVCAQTDLPRIELAALTTSPNWKQARSVQVNPDVPGLKTQPGSAVLVGTGNEPLTLASPVGDFALQFDMLLTSDADVRLTLPNGHSLSLNHSRDMMPLLKEAGLWQTIALAYRAGTARNVPMLEKLTLNGATVYEGQSLERGTLAQPVRLMTQKGSVALRNAGFRALANRQVALWAGPLTYKLYGESIDTRDGLSGKTPVKTDTVSRISYDVSYGQPGRFAMTFDGKLNVPTTGDYQFDLFMGGVAGLWIDGKPVIPMGYEELGGVKTTTQSLTAGLHDAQVMFSKSWPRPGLGLFVSQVGVRPQALHAEGSLPEFSPAPQIALQPEVRPTLIRSFIQLPGERNKRTKALSVGSSAGLNYSLDLDQMTLLMAWKGNFADVTEMWYERGEPQLLEPMGTVVRPSPRPALAMLSNANAPWPDSLSEKVLIYTGYSLNKAGAPTMDYTLAGLTVKESFVPTGNRLERTFSITGNVPAQPLYCRLAAGKTIEEVAKGLFAIDDRSYYIRVDPSTKLTLRQMGTQQELMMPVALQNGTGTARYTLEF